MTRIGSVGSLGTEQLRALSRLTEIGKAISQNQQWISTLNRINSAKDDPSGLVQATLLEAELTAAEQASKTVTRASALLATADAAAGEVLTQLQSARTLVLAAADETLSSSAVAGNQVQVDEIIRTVNRLAKTEFSSKRLLDGSAGFRTTGVDTTKILDINVLDKTTTDDVSVSINVTQQATQQTYRYSDGALGSDTTLVVTGPDGTTTVELNSGANTQTITDAFNAITYATGITATRIDASNIDFTTVEYGSDVTFSISATAGTFDTTTQQTGTDALATINGQQFTGDGTVFNVNTNQLLLAIELDPSASGNLSPFTVSGNGLEFIIGSQVSSTARIGLGNMHTSILGGVIGKLSSIASGGANTLTAGKTAEALKILDDAIADVSRTQAIICGFKKFTLDSSSRILDIQIENVSSEFSAIQDTDLALEVAKLANNQLLEKSTLQALSIMNLRNQEVLGFLASTVRRFQPSLNKIRTETTNMSIAALSAAAQSSLIGLLNVSREVEESPPTYPEVFRRNRTRASHRHSMRLAVCPNCDSRH